MDGQNNSDEKKLKKVSDRWFPYQWPWTDRYDRRMNFKDWLLSRKFTITYLITIWFIAMYIGFGSTLRCAESWQLSFICEHVMWMIQFKTDIWAFIRSFFTAPYFHNGVDHIWFVTLFGFTLTVQAFETQHGAKAAFFYFTTTYIFVGLMTGPLFNYGLEIWPDVHFFYYAFERNWMGGSAGAFSMMGGLTYFSGKRWAIPSIIISFEILNLTVIGNNVYITFIHSSAAVWGFFISYLWTQLDPKKVMA